MLRLGHVFVFFLWICSLTLVVVAGQSSRDDLPFHFIAACPPAGAATTNSTDTGNSSRTTDNQRNTALLFFDSSALTSSSLCQCDLHSTGQFHVSKLWSEGNISTPVSCGGSAGSPDDGVRECDWGEDNQIKGIPADGVKVEMRRRHSGDGGSPSYAVLLVRAGESSVNIDCRMKEEEVTTNSSSTVAASTGATTSTTTANTTTTTTTTINSNTSASETASASDASSSLQTTLGMTSPGAAGKTQTTQVTSEEESSVPTFPSSEQAKGPSDGQEEEKEEEEEEEDDDDDSLSFIILGLGVGLACLAIVAIGITVCCVSKKLKRRRHSDAESALVRQQSTKSCAHNDCGANDDYEITEGDTKENASTTALRGSRASLLSEKHNYEDVTVDMVPPTVAPKPAPRKASNQSLPPPSNYSRIHPAGKRNVRGTTSLPPNTKAPSSDADVPEADNKDEDDYSELDLAHSTRQPSVTLSPASLPVTVLRICAVNDEYMDVGEGDDDVEPEDPADIYEAVDDGDEEKTPLYGGRSRSRNDYTDCMSGSTGKIHLCTGEVNEGFDGSGPDAGEPEQPPSQRRPSLPTSPPPKAGAAGKPPGLSRSLDDMAPGTDEPEENTLAPLHRPTHRHSKSEDLTGNMSRCQQRDLFLERFRSQGDGAEADERDSGDQQAQENDYTEVPSTAPNADIPYPSTQPRDNQADSPERTARESSPDKIVMRRKSRNSKAMNGGKAAGPVSMADHLKKLNTGLLELETAVRHSMEIQEDELIMIDNVLYGTLPRNNSLPTTEL